MECPICFEKIWVTETSCKHNICIKCILELKDNICPFCRKKNIFNNLPIQIKRICKMFNKNTKKNNNNTTNNVNIDNYFDFPPLS